MYSNSWPRSRALVAIGHHASTLLIASIVAAIGLGLFPPQGLAGFGATLVVLSVVIGSFLLMRRHDRGLCEACVAEIPLDAGARAKRLQRRFWMAHTGSEPRFLGPYLLVLIASNFAVSSPMGKLLWALVQLSMIYLVLSARTHRQLQPWCPWCREGGGGEDVEQTPPVIPHDDRQLT